MALLLEVFTPDALAVVAAVTAVLDHQDGGPPSERFVGQTPGDGIAWNPGRSARLAPWGRVGHLADDLSFLRREALPDGGEPQSVKVGESREICGGIDRMVHSRGL